MVRATIGTQIDERDEDVASLVVMTVLALVLAFGGARALSRVETRVADAESERRLDRLRADTETTWPDWVTGSWALLCLGAAVTSLVRGEVLGLAWIVVSVLLLAALTLIRRARARTLDLLGDRGRVARTDRYHRRRRLSLVLLAVALSGYLVERFVAQVFDDPRPDAAVAVAVVGIVAQVVGLLGALAVRTRMWLAGDDLDRPSSRGSAAED